MPDMIVHINGEDEPRRFSGDVAQVKNALDQKYAQVRTFASTARGDVDTVLSKANREITDPENRRILASLMLRSNPIESVRSKIQNFMDYAPFQNPLEGGPEISMGDIARTGIDFVPGVGDIKSGAEAVAFAQEGRPGMAALSGLGALPFIPSVAGVVGKHAPDLAGKIDDLPMDEASRMGRARELGFYESMPLFHGTAKDFKEFKMPTSTTESVSRSPVGTLGVSLAIDPKLANEFASRAGPEGSNVIPALHRAKNPVSIDLDGTETNEEIFATVSDAWEKGFDSIKFNNYTTKEGGGGQSFILVKDPSQVRSKFAAFDPKKKLSPNLLAGAAGATLISGGLIKEDEEQ